MIPVTVKDIENIDNLYSEGSIVTLGRRLKYNKTYYYCPLCNAYIGNVCTSIKNGHILSYGTVLEGNEWPDKCPSCGCDFTTL